MKTVGIIAEYNPFHNGHKHHIEQSKKQSGADCAVAVMSGAFVQRGAPAVADKFLRAECALFGGADLVIELPVFYAVSGAEVFASGAVSLLDSLGGIDFISFGTETGDLTKLTKLAALLADEPEEYRALLKKYLADGIGFPAARSRAVTEFMQSSEHGAPFLSDAQSYDGLSQILEEPNNILAVEYLKALIRSGSKIRPVAVKRLGNGYHDIAADTDYPSASAVRNVLYGNNIEAAAGLIPKEAYTRLCKAYKKSFPIDREALSSLINYSVLQNLSQLEDFYDVTPSLANKIRNAYAANKQPSFNVLSNTLKSRELTHTRICRSLIHILLDIRQTDADRLIRAGYPAYARVLGFNDTGREFLGAVKSFSTVPIITNCARAQETLSDDVSYLFRKDIFATDVYNNAVQNRYKTKLPDDYRCKPIICNGSSCV